MNKKNSINVYFNSTENGNEEILKVTKDPKFFLDIEEIIKISGISKKQFELYLYRHKNDLIIKKYTINQGSKIKKIRLVQISIIDYIIKNSKRILNDRNKPNN